jgi:hypothetical protein
MNIAIALQHKLITSLRCIWDHLLQPSRLQGHPQAPLSTARVSPHRYCVHPVAKQVRATKGKTLRVVRVMESGQHRNSVGRMVISGSMADVCAELDRLAACESVLH